MYASSFATLSRGPLPSLKISLFFRMADLGDMPALIGSDSESVGGISDVGSDLFAGVENNGTNSVGAAAGATAASSWIQPASPALMRPPSSPVVTSSAAFVFTERVLSCPLVSQSRFRACVVLFHASGPKRNLNLSPKARARLAQRHRDHIVRRRVHKNCKLCKRSTNCEDCVNKRKRMRWGYGNKFTLCPETGNEIMQGKIDHYCSKVLYA